MALRRVSASSSGLAGRWGGAAKRGHGSHRATRNDRDAGQGDLAGPFARFSPWWVAQIVEQPSQSNARRDGCGHGGDEAHFGLGKWTVGLALDDHGAQRAIRPEDWNRQKGWKTVFIQLGKGPIRGVVCGPRDRYRVPKLHSFAGDPLANGQSDLAAGSFGKADVTAHDQGAAVAFEQVERSDLSIGASGDFSRSLVEQHRQRFSRRHEGQVVEHLVHLSSRLAMEPCVRWHRVVQDR